MTTFDPTLLAVFDEIARGFNSYSRRSGSLSANALLVVGVLLIAAVWAALYFWDRWRRRDQRKNAARAKSMFDELVAVHALDRDDRRLLARAAELAGFEEPAVVFVRPDVLSALGQASDTDRESVDRLARQLYGDQM